MGLMRKCYRCLSALARRGGLIAQAARTRRRQGFRQSAPPGQALEMGSCNIAAANVDLQGLGRDRAIRTNRGAVARTPIDEPFLAPACPPVTGAPTKRRRNKGPASLRVSMEPSARSCS